MSRQAQLADGTILDFPDETPDAVMDRAVKGYLTSAPPPPPPPPPGPSMDWSQLPPPTAEGIARNRLPQSSGPAPIPARQGSGTPDFGTPSDLRRPQYRVRPTSFTSAERPEPRIAPPVPFGRPEGAPAPPPRPTPGFGTDLKRGLATLGTTLDLVPYGLETFARAQPGGDYAADHINRLAAQYLGMNPEGSAGVLKNDISYINSIPTNPTIDRAGARYAAAPDFLSGVAEFGGEVLRHPSVLPHLLTESAPSLLVGEGFGKVATKLAEPVIGNVAVNIGAKVASRARIGAYGAGFNTGLTVANAGGNVAARYNDPAVNVSDPKQRAMFGAETPAQIAAASAMPDSNNRLAEAVREGLLQTGAQIPTSALAGALLPVQPFRGMVGEVGNAGVQAGIQGTGNLASVMAGNAAIGRETTPAEKAAAFGGGALFAPVDVAIRLRQEARARAEGIEADYQARREQAQSRVEREAAAVHGQFSEAPVKTKSGYATTADGIIAGDDGSPVAFRTAKEAARFAVDNDLAGDFELEAWGANSDRVILRKRARPAEAPPEQPAAAEPAAGQPHPEPQAEPPAAAAPEPRAEPPVRQEPPEPPTPRAEPAPPPPEAPPLAGANLRPEAGPLEDGESYVTTPAGNKVKARFEVVDANALQHAEGDLQNRDRSRNSTALQVQDIISNFDPSRLGDAPESDRGAPIVGPDGVIESGNGRVMALRRIYAEHPEKAQAYKDFLISQGHDVSGVNEPVLIRRRTTDLSPEQRRQFVIDSNKDAKLAMTATERARSDADGLNHSTLGLYRGGDVSKVENAAFVRAFKESLAPAERAGMEDDSGGVSQEGIRRIENALLARAYENPDLLAKLMETRDNNIRSIGGALLDNSAGWAGLRADVKAGHIKPEYDVTAQLVEAARKVSDARAAGAKPADVLAQSDAFNPMDPVTEQFIRAFHNTTMTKAVSRDAVADVLKSYVTRAAEQTTAPRLLAGESPSPAEILKSVLRERDEKVSGGLFAALGGEPKPEPPTSIAAEDRAPPRRQGVLADRAGKVGPVYRDLGDALDEESGDDVGYDGSTELDQQDRADLAEAGPYDPIFAAESFTNRTSIYDTAAIAAGMDPDKFRLLPSQKQIALLKKVIHQTFGIVVDVKHGFQDRFVIDQLLDAYQNVRGMAHVLGLPSTAIGLKGALRLQLQKNARFLGAYSPGEKTIFLPGRSNSFSHEWGHALDFFLIDAIGDGRGKGFSGAIRARGEGMADGHLAPSRDIREAFIDLLNAMFFDKAALAATVMKLETAAAATKGATTKAQLLAQIERIKAGASQMRGGRTDFYKGAQEFDGPGGDYWTSPTEMLARSFEAYVSHRAEESGFSTEFIGKGDASYLSNADERFEKTFPKGEERARIFAAYDVVFRHLGASELLGQGRAERPDVVTSSRADMARPPEKLDHGNWFTRMMAQEVGAATDFLIRRAKARENRPDNPVTPLQRAQDVFSYWTYGLTARMKMIGRRYNSPTIRALHNMLTHNTGSGEATGRGYLQAIELRINTYVNQIDRTLERYAPREGGRIRKELTSAEARIIRDLLISEDVPNAPANFVKLAADLRRLSDSIFYDLQRAGIDVGYTRNGHLARMIDLPIIESDTKGFLKQAAKVYEIVFDKHFGEDPNDILGDDEKLKEFLKLARRMAKVDPNVDPTAVITLLRQLARLGEQMANSDNPDRIQAKVDELSAKLEEEMGELMGPVRSAFARQSAEDWLLRIMSAAPDEFDKRGPSQDFTKKRVLPAEADKLLEKYYINDPIEVMATYSTQAARRIEYATRFGQDSSKLRNMLDKMVSEGVPNVAIHDIQRIVNLATGRSAQRLNPTVNSFISAVQVIYGTIALLPRAVFSSMAESLTAGIVTGNAGNGVKAFAALVEGALGTASAKERREIARFIGLVQAQGGHEILLNRFGGTYGDLTRWDRIAAKMFYKSGLIALTRAQQTHMIGVAHGFLDGLAGRILEAAKRPDEKGRVAKDAAEARARMKELGIRDVDAFSKQIRDTGRLPTIDELADAMGGKNAYAFDWTTAVSRIVSQVIQNPTVMDRPEASTGPMGRLAYGIMAFNYAFWRNIMKGEAVRVWERGKRSGPAYAAEKFAFGLLPAVALLMLGQFFFSTLREYLTNRARWQRSKEDGTLDSYLIWISLTRTFGTPIDPLVQGFTGLKYQRDLTAVPVGPALGNILMNLQAIVMPLSRNSPKTNTSEYNAAKGFYRLGIDPWLGAGLSAAPGGPIVSGLTGVATGYVTSPVAGDEFASFLFGPSDAAHKKHKVHGREPAREKEDRGKGRPKEREAVR